jgi:4-amino-4-deoxy-L-arabinose transferase-like glycosyltransferase
MVAMAAAAVTRERSTARPAVTSGTLAAVGLVVITALAAGLRLWSFADVPANPFYDAAVRSMSQSWHNFFYGAFEPSGQVSIDKIPVDLWLQVASTKLFGYNSTALRLPELLAGVLAVPLLYDLVRRVFGRPAGLAAATALAVLPLSVLTARSDTMDAVMMLLDVLAGWLVVRGTQRRRAWPIVAAGAVMGLAFNVKLFESLIVLPALGLLALLAGDLPLRRRAVALAGGLVAFIGVGLAWVIVASQAPLGARPWPIGSTNGGVWNVVFRFNGLDRLRGSATPRALALDPPGAVRLFGGGARDYASIIGTTLLGALVFGALALIAAAVFRRRAGRTRLELANAIFLGSWLILGVALMSHMQRLQPRYLEAVTPAVAGVLGAGLGWLSAHAATRRSAGAVLALGAAVVAGAGTALVHPPTWAAALAMAGAAVTVLAAAGVRGRLTTTLLATGALVAALAIPSAAALSVARGNASDAGLANPMQPARVRALSTFLTAHQGRAFYEVASTTVFKSGPLIVRDGRPVLMLTSYSNRPLLTPAQLARLVAAGKVRYILIGRGEGSPRSKPYAPPVVRWARAHSVDVSRATGVGPPGTLSRFTSVPAD